jgi:hypothetical protein
LRSDKELRIANVSTTLDPTERIRVTHVFS